MAGRRQSAERNFAGTPGGTFGVHFATAGRPAARQNDIPDSV